MLRKKGRQEFIALKHLDGIESICDGILQFVNWKLHANVAP